MGRIENLLKMPWEYNFEFECGDKEYENLDTFERYFTYKTAHEKSSYDEAQLFINEHSDYSDVYDPDGSGYKYYPLTRKIYARLWGWKKSNRTTFGVCKGAFDDSLFGGDTMNSVQTVLGWIAGKNSKSRYSVHWTLNCWCSDIKLEKLWKEMGIKEYIDAYHTLGNFVLVPASYNNKRGTDINICDFWDRSLKALKNDDFNIFKSSYFEKYVNYFFLWDYVNVCENNKKYCPRTDLSEGLCSEKSIDELKHTNFFKETTKLINRRGKFMTAMLMIQNQDPALYNKIQTFLTTKDFTAKSIFDAAKKILDNQPERKFPENESATNLLVELEKGKV